MDEECMYIIICGFRQSIWVFLIVFVVGPSLQVYFYYQFKISLFSMRKIQTGGGKQSNRLISNEQHHSPIPKKQFQLLYRQRDPEYSQQPFESIIFVKSKKCDNKNGSQKRKTDQKSKHHPAQQWKQMVEDIQTTLKDHQSKQQKKVEESKKQILKPNPTQKLSNKSHSKENAQGKTSSRWNKYRKDDVLSSDNVKKYRNILSPSRSIKHKQSETVSSKFLKTTQETFRKETSKPKDKKSKKQDGVGAQPEEYVLLENNFVFCSSQDANLLNMKINSNKTLPSNAVRPQPLGFRDYSEQESPFQEQSVNWSERIQLQQSNHSFHSSEKQQFVSCENTLEVVQKYIQSKVKIIQRWWRKMLQAKGEELAPILFHPDQDSEQFDKSLLFMGSQTPSGSGEVSPIKIVQQLDKMNDRAVQDNSNPLKCRQAAATQQRQIHIQLLQSLLHSKKISPLIFSEKRMLIEAKYQHEMQQIDELRKLIAQNREEAVQICRKTEEDRQKIENLSSEINESTLDQIFGKDFAYVPQADPTQPQQHQVSFTNRQKSTGCHYQGEQKQISIYRKSKEQPPSSDQEEDEEYAQDFEQCEQNIQTNQYSNQFHELLDEYKQRQQIKIQIDRRAALQMSVVPSQIPEQFRSQYVGIQTSLNSIHRFVLSFFKFYIFYYRDDFLKLINMPYGLNFDTRIAMMHGHQIDPDGVQDQMGVIYGIQAIIPEETLDQFYQKIYEGGVEMTTAQKASLQFQKVHNRALLDAFNEALNAFRPYFAINGPPYPWNHSQKALTFYYIAEENIQQVFEKSQFKLLKWASSLCGIILPRLPTQPLSIENYQTQEIIETYRSHCQPTLFQVREQRLSKSEKAQILQNNHQWSLIDEQLSMILLQIGDLAFAKILDEIAQQMMNFGEINDPEASTRSPNESFFGGYEEDYSNDE